jgi:hypothetical protein
MVPYLLGDLARALMVSITFALLFKKEITKQAERESLTSVLLRDSHVDLEVVNSEPIEVPNS